MKGATCAEARKKTHQREQHALAMAEDLKEPVEKAVKMSDEVNDTLKELPKVCVEEERSSWRRRTFRRQN